MATSTSTATKAVADSAKTLSHKGTVAQVIGEVTVLTASGETRVLHVGDKVGPGDTIQTGADGAVAISFENGANINLGHADSLTFTEQMLADLLKPANTAADDAARIQELIAQGADPTQVAAASAAGAGGGEDGGHSFVVLDAPNSRVGIESGFATDGIAQGGPSPDVEPPNGFIPEANQPPTAVDDVPSLVNGVASTDDALTVKEDSVLQIPAARLLSNDTDPDGDVLVIIGIGTATNGTAVLNADGSITYTPNANFNGNDSFTYTVSDGKGGVSTATVTIGVIPVGEPQITVPDDNGITPGNISIVENSTSPVTGTFTIQADEGINSISVNGQTISLAQLNALATTPLSITTDLGTLTLTGYNATTGAVSYSYAVEAGGQDHSAGDNSVQDLFALSMTDGIGQTSTATLDVLITDTAPIANPDFNSLTEDGFIFDERVEKFEQNFFDNEEGNPQEQQIQAFGNVILGSPAGADTLGADTTVVTGVATGDLGGTVSGQVGAILIGMYGSLSLASDGSYVYTLNNSSNAVQGLGHNEQGKDVFTYTITDADGDTSTALLTITINGTNDAPELKVDTSGGVTEDVNVVVGALADSGVLSFSDVDVNDTHTVSSTYNGDAAWNGGALSSAQLAAVTSGFTVDSSGWNYSVANGAVQFLAAGESITLSFNVTVTDSSGTANDSDTQTVTITINGTNDAPVLVVDASGAVTEDVNVGNGFLTDSGTLSFSDVDVSDTHTVSSTYNNDAVWSGGTLTSAQLAAVTSGLTVDSSGWNYSVFNGAVQFLGAGETITLSFNVAVTDSSGSANNSDTEVVTITINGSNDAPILRVDTSGCITEDVAVGNGFLTDSGVLSFSDVDQTDAHTFSSVYNNDAHWSGGTLTPAQLTAVTSGLTVDNNSWDYSVFNGAVQFLAAGETITLSFNVTVTDDSGSANNSDTETVTITIKGTNDAPVLHVDTNGSVTEDVAVVSGQVTDSGVLSFHDVDTTDTHVVSSSYNSDAVWSGGVLTSAQIAAITTGFSVDNNSWDYTASNSALQFLAKGETIVLSFNVKVTDNSGAANNSDTEKVTLTIHGTNDTPTITTDSGNPQNTNDLVYESGLLSGTNPNLAARTAIGTFTFSDADGLDDIQGVKLVSGSHTAIFTDEQLEALNSGSPPVLTMSTDLGLITLTAYNELTGTVSYKYELQHPTTDLAGNETDQFTVAVTDSDAVGAVYSSPATITITIIDDAPITKPDTNSATEDLVLSASGNVVTDALTGDKLGADQPLPNHYVVGVAIGNHTADAAALAGNVSGTVVGTYGSLVLNADGSYTYTLNNAASNVQSLHAGQSVNDVFSYTIQDADGDWSTTTLTIAVNGTNDVPTITNLTPAQDGGDAMVWEDDLLSSRAANESEGSHSVVSSPLSATGTFNVSSPEGISSLTISIGANSIEVVHNGVFTAHSINSPFGTLSIDSFSGGVVSYSYTLKDNALTTPNADDGRLSVFDNFTVALNDGDQTVTNTLSINIVDDIPHASTFTLNTVITPVDSNLQITLDLSGSMDSTKLSLAKNSINELIDRYSALGDVRVMLVTFSDSATVQHPAGSSNTWLTAAEAKAILVGLSAGGNTNYDAALQQIVSHYNDAGKLNNAGVQNVAYFLSDGEPTTTSAPSVDVGISPTEQVAWENFLKANDINSFAFGMGSGSVTSTLNPIAYNGVLETGSGSTVDAIKVINLTDLPAALGSTVAQASVVVNLLQNGDFGADGGHVDSFTLDGVTYNFNGTSSGTANGSYNASTHVWTVNTNGSTAAGGVLTMDMDTGLGSYNPTISSAISEVMSFTLIDNDGDKALGQATFTLNVPPTVTLNADAIGDKVYESGLPTGSDAAANSEITTGSFKLADGNGLADIQTVTINNQTVNISNLVGSSFNSANGVMTIDAYNSSTGNVSYTFKLTSATTDLADSETNTFTIKASDGAHTGATTTLSIEIVDDVPVAQNITLSSATQVVETNLVLNIDVSGSMDGDRIGIAKNALSQLIDKYDQIGDVRIMLVSFSSDANLLGSNTWLSVNAAKTLINSLSAGGNTNFDAALAQVTAHFSDYGKFTSANAQNVSYFLSDGEPTVGGGITGSEITNWTNFVDANNINSLAFGIGSGATLSTLAPIAYNGVTNTDPSNGVTLVTNANNLPAALTNTVQPIISINLLSGGSFGADGGHINSLQVDGTTYNFGDVSKTLAQTGGVYSYDALSHLLTVNTKDGSAFNNGVLTIDLDTGLGQFTGPVTLNQPLAENVNFTLIDNDGDISASKVLSLTIAAAPGGNNIVDDNTGHTITGSTLNDTIDGNGGNDTISGLGGDDRLDGGAGSDTLNGGEGNDVLYGGADADTLNGNNGNDVLIGGAGNDILNGGAGSDIFVFSALGSNGNDTIQDFTVANTSSGGDVLDVTDLLSGAGITNATFMANEGAFLQFISDGSGNTKVMFDANGTAGSGVGGHGDAVQVATLNGVTGVDSATLLNQLLANGEIQSHR